MDGKEVAGMRRILTVHDLPGASWKAALQTTNKGDARAVLASYSGSSCCWELRDPDVTAHIYSETGRCRSCSLL